MSRKFERAPTSNNHQFANTTTLAHLVFDSANCQKIVKEEPELDIPIAYPSLEESLSEIREERRFDQGNLLT